MRDAYDRATNIKNREIYAGHFLELSEATSGSYLAHFALMGALLLLSVFLLIPAPPRTQVTEIEFVTQTPTDQIKKLKQLESPRLKPDPKECTGENCRCGLNKAKPHLHKQAHLARRSKQQLPNHNPRRKLKHRPQTHRSLLRLKLQTLPSLQLL